MSHNSIQPQLLRSENCCLHIIDPQQSLMNHIYEADRVTAIINRMLECAAILQLPVLANTQYKKGLGLYVPELETKMAGIERPDKVEFNAWANEETMALVQKLPDQVNTVILVGVETHICIYQTAIGILQHGFTPWVVSDGVSSRSKENYDCGLDRLKTLGAIVGPSEMIIYELLAKAGTSEFKAMLPHII